MEGLLDTQQLLGGVIIGQDTAEADIVAGFMRFAEGDAEMFLGIAVPGTAADDV
jgi:hypothetical protein